MARLARRAARREGPDARPLRHAQAARAGPREPGRRPRAAQHRLHQHHPARARAVVPRRRGRSSAGSARSSAGTPRSWCRGANRKGLEVGGHIATYQSAASLYEVGFNHFFRGKDHPGGGDQIFIQGHGSPGIYARAFLEGRLTEDQLDGFRQEVSHGSGQGPVVVPAPPADAGLLGVPDGLDGPHRAQLDLPGALQPLPAQPRDQGHQPAARLGVPRRRRDGRARVARRDRRGRARGARQPHVRHQLQPAAARRAGARQRQDHPGARVDVPRRRLERHQGRVGPRVGRRCSPATSTACWSTR